VTDLLDLGERVLQLMGDRAEAEVTVTAGRTALTRFANSTIHQNVADQRLAVRLRLVAGGRLAASGTDRTDAPALRRLVESTLEAATLRPVDPGWPGLAPAVPVDGGGAHRWDPATASAPADRRADVVAAFVQAGAGMEAAGYCASTGHRVAFVNSAGRRAEARVTSATVDGILRLRGVDGSGWQEAGRLDEIDGSSAGRTAAAKARRGTDPEPSELPPGRYPVVLEPACVADLLDFLVGDGFSAKAHAEGRSFVRLGERQLDPAISIADDATDPRSVDLPFDAEGTPRHRLELVVDGVPRALLHDRRTAARAGVASTGNATPAGESYGPAPSTLVLAPGAATPDELIAGVDRGLLVTEFWYTRILDPKTSVVTGLTRNGTFLIEGGKVTRGVRNLRFTQSYAEALAPGNVVAVGADARLRGQGAIVPSLHLAGWNFTGGARG
jgi:predicted Zn-dependent protease